MVVETCPKCGEPLINLAIDTYPPIPRKECPNCGWFWEGEPETIKYVLFVDTALENWTQTDNKENRGGLNG